MFEPLGLLLSIFYGITKSYGAAIIMLTIVVRLVLFPLTAKQMRSMNAMARVQPEIKRMQAQYRDDRQKLNEEMMKFYKQEGINPAAGCLPLLLQIPVFIGLFRVIRGLSSSNTLHWLGVRVPTPEYLKPDSEMYRSIVRSGGKLLSFGIDLAQSAAGTKQLPYIALVVVYAVSGWVQQSLANRRNPVAATGPGAQMQQIMKIFPIFMGIFAYSMPAGLVLYWFASNLWTIGQQEILAHTIPRVDPSVIEAQAEETTAAAEKADKPAKPDKAGKVTGKSAATAATAASKPLAASSGTKRSPAPAAEGSLLERARAAAEAKAAAKNASQNPKSSSPPAKARPGGAAPARNLPQKSKKKER